MKCFMKWSLRMILIMAMVLVVISVGFTQEKVTITVQDYYGSVNDNGRFIDEMAVEFEKNHPDVKVNHIAIPFAQYLPTILQQSLTKTVPDITMADNPWVPQLIKAGTYKDITDKVKEWGWENWEDFFKGHREVTSSEGKIYAFQFTTNSLALFYRKSLLDKAGIANPPETWQELKEDCKKIREVLDIYGFAFDASATEGGTWQFEPFLWSNGGSLLELDQPEAIEALQFLTDMVKEGYIPRDIVNIGSQGDLTQWFINGEVAFMVNGNWEFGWQLTEDVMQRLGDVNVAPLPVPKKGMRTIVPFGGECFGISSNIDPAKYDLAWEFLKLLVSSDNMLRLNKNSLGGLPTRASVAEKILAEKPILKVFLEQSHYALPRPLMGGIDKYPDVSSTVWVAIQKALTEMATPEEAFKEAARTIQGIFSTEDYEMYKQLARKLLQEASGK
jgi:multiple sugar transport system substrate-binding protein